MSERAKPRHGRPSATTPRLIEVRASQHSPPANCLTSRISCRSAACCALACPEVGIEMCVFLFTGPIKLQSLFKSTPLLFRCIVSIQVTMTRERPRCQFGLPLFSDSTGLVNSNFRRAITQPMVQVYRHVVILRRSEKDRRRISTQSLHGV